MTITAVNDHFNCEAGDREKCFLTHWNHYDEELVVAAEIYSKWGSSECDYREDQPDSDSASCLLVRTKKYNDILAEDGDKPCYYKPCYFIQNALAKGLKLGFVAGSDSHMSKPGGQNEPEYTPYYGRGAQPGEGARPWPRRSEAGLIFANAGLTGVWSPSQTRADIFDGMKARRTVATTGVRTKVKFWATDDADQHYLMGDSFETAAAFKLHAVVESHGNQYPTPGLATDTTPGAKVVKIEIVKGSADPASPHSTPPFRTLCEDASPGDCTVADPCTFECEDADFVADKQNAFYYLRVTQEKFPHLLLDEGGTTHEMQLENLAWSSPIWVDYAAQTEPAQSSTYYLPLMVRDQQFALAGTAISYGAAQRIDEAAGDLPVIRQDFVDGQGIVVASREKRAIAHGDSMGLTPNPKKAAPFTCGQVDAGFLGSSVVTSPVPVAAVTYTNLLD